LRTLSRSSGQRTLAIRAIGLQKEGLEIEIWNEGEK
jgi:hypothetical protein